MIDSLGFVTLPETAATCSWETIRRALNPGPGIGVISLMGGSEKSLFFRVNRTSWNFEQSQCLLSAGGYCKKSEAHRKSLIMTQSLSDINED